MGAAAEPLALSFTPQGSPAARALWGRDLLHLQLNPGSRVLDGLMAAASLPVPASGSRDVSPEELEEGEGTRSPAKAR